MRPTFQVNVSRLEQLLRKRLQSSKKSAEIVVNEAVAIFAMQAAKLTPPTVGSHTVGGWSQQKASGERALERDLNKAFFPVPRIPAKNRFESEFLFVNSRNGNRYLVRNERDKTTAGMAEIRQLHLSVRNRRGRVRELRVPFRNLGNRTFEVMKFVVSTSAFRAYLRHEKTQVGKGKAGWIAVHRRAGGRGRFPAFVQRHAGGSGVASAFNASRSLSRYSVTFGNLVEHIQDAGRRANVIRLAMTYTANKYQRMLAHWVKQQGGPISKPLLVGPTALRRAAGTVIDV